jgi:hypothetical protein
MSPLIRAWGDFAMSKDKKKKKDRKSGKSGSTIKTLAQNPLVADVVAAALVATASALKDSKRARALASEAGDELAKLSKANADRGSALWDMALQIGRRSLEAIMSDEAPKRSPKSRAKPKTSTKKGGKKPANTSRR